MLVKQVQKARAVSTPLISISTADPGATIASLVGKNVPGLRGLQDSKKEVPMMSWDAVRGMIAQNDVSREIVNQIWPRKGKDQRCPTASLPVMALSDAVKLPEESVLFIHAAGELLSGPMAITIAQAIWNLRDAFVRDNRMLVLLGPDVQMPPSLVHDVVPYDEKLPDRKQLQSIVLEQVKNAGQTEDIDPTAIDVDRAVDATTGLSSFAASNALVLSMRLEKGKAEIDLEALWHRKEKMIGATRGLKVLRSDQPFSDIGGHDHFKSFLQDIMSGKRRPASVVFIDEIEKFLGTASTELSGTTGDALGHILKFMEDSQSTGIILVGPAGTGKSCMAKAAGIAGQCPTLSLDFGECKGSLVGQSQQYIRAATKIIDAISAGRSLWIATSNNLEKLPTELIRRFNFGVWFCDMPDAAEKKAIWKVWRKRYPDVKGKLPDDEGWTGSEIRTCCDMADRLEKPLAAIAKQYIVPLSQRDPEIIDRLRKSASGSYLSTVHDGAYRMAGEIRTEKPDDLGGKTRSLHLGDPSSN